MLENIKRQWLSLKTDEPGFRFQNYYRRRHEADQHAAKHLLLLIAGVLLILVGAAMMIAPGPGILVGALGAAIIAGESRRAARWLDAGEIAGRKMLRRMRSRH